MSRMLVERARHIARGMSDRSRSGSLESSAIDHQNCGTA